MRSPPRRPRTPSPGVDRSPSPLAAGPVAAVLPPTGLPETELSVLLDVLGGALLSLVVCGVLLLVARDYTERTTDRIHESPGETFLYGLGLVVVGFVLVVLLTLTIVGVVLVVPLVITALVFGQLGYLAAARAVVDDWRAVLLVAVAVAAITAGVPVVGGLVGFVLSCTGIGAWYLDYRDDSSPDTGDATTPGGSSWADGWSVDRAGTATAAGTTDDTGRGAREGSDAEPDPAEEWTAGFEDAPDRE